MPWLQGFWPETTSTSPQTAQSAGAVGVICKFRAVAVKYLLCCLGYDCTSTIIRLFVPFAAGLGTWREATQNPKHNMGRGSGQSGQMGNLRSCGTAAKR